MASSFLFSREEQNPFWNPQQRDVTQLAKDIGMSLGYQVTASVAALASHTLAPNLENGCHHAVKLDADLTLANATAGRVDVGTRVRFALQQDATGGRGLTLGANYLGASHFLPRQGPNQTSWVEFIVLDDGTLRYAGHDGIDLSHTFNVRDFGAVLDGTTDDLTAIQAAINKAETQGGGRVFIGGRTTYSRPLRVHGNWVMVEGLSEYTMMQPSGYYGPAAFVGPSLSLASVLTTSLLTGSGNAFSFDSNYGGGSAPLYQLNFRHQVNAWFGGLSHITIRCQFKVTGQGIGNFPQYSPIFTTGGKRATGEANANAAGLQIDNYGNDVTFVLTIGGSRITATANSVLTNGASHNLEATYDGANMRIFVNGVVVKTQAQTGTLQEKDFEDIMIGGQTLFAPYGTDSTPPGGIVDSLSVVASALHTANFTPPTSKYDTSTPNTILLTNFETVDGMLKAYTNYGTSTKPVYIPIASLSLNTGNFIEGSGFERVAFQGSAGLFFQRVNRAKARAVYSPACGAYGLWFHDNCFGCDVIGSEVHVDASGYGGRAFAGTILSGNSSVAKLQDLWSFCHTVGVWAQSGNVTITNGYYEGGTINMAFLNGAGEPMTVKVDGVQATDEAWQAVTSEGVLFLDGLYGFHAASCNFEMTNGMNVAITPIKIAAQRAGSAVFDACTFSAGASATELFHKVSGAGTVYPVRVVSPSLGPNSAVFPWSTTAGLVRLEEEGPIAVNRAASPYSALRAARYLCDATAGAVTFNLPAATAFITGEELVVKKTDSSGNAVTVTAAGADKIDGSGTFTLGAQYKYVRLVSDGVSAWEVLGSN